MKMGHSSHEKCIATPPQQWLFVVQVIIIIIAVCCVQQAEETIMKNATHISHRYAVFQPLSKHTAWREEKNPHLCPTSTTRSIRTVDRLLPLVYRARNLTDHAGGQEFRRRRDFVDSLFSLHVLLLVDVSTLESCVFRSAVMYIHTSRDSTQDSIQQQYYYYSTTTAVQHGPPIRWGRLFPILLSSQQRKKGKYIELQSRGAVGNRRV